MSASSDAPGSPAASTTSADRQPIVTPVDEIVSEPGAGHQLWTWPVPARWVFVPTLLVGVVTSAQMAQVLRWPFVDLPAVSALPLATLLVTGPVAAAAAAWVASRTWSPQSPLGSAAAARSGHPLAHRQGLVLAGWFVAAFVLATLPVVLVSDAKAAAGQVQWALYVYAVAALLVFLGIGFAIGAVLPYRLSFLIASGVAGLLGVIEVYVPSTRAVRALVPLVADEFHVGDAAPAAGWLLKAGLVLITTLALLWCAGHWPEVQYSRSALVLAAAPLLATLGGAGALAASGPALHATDGDLARECDAPVERSGPAICLPPQQAGARDSIERAVTGTLAAVGGAPAQLTTVSSDVLDPNRRRGDTTSADGARATSPSTVWVNVHPEADIEAATQRALLTYLSGAYACAAGAQVNFVVRSGEIDLAIQYQLESGTKDGTQALSAWYSENQDAILACRAPAVPAEASPTAVPPSDS